MSQPLCLVACGASKRDSRQVAWKLYESTPFEKSWTAAMCLGHPYVMSAKHGILSPTDRIDPYDETLRNKSWDVKVEWAKSLEIPSGYDTLVLFGGRDYVEPICEVYAGAYDIRDVYSETSGIGEQMRLAGQIANKKLGCDE